MDQSRQSALPRFSKLPQPKSISPPPPLEPDPPCEPFAAAKPALGGPLSKRNSVAIPRASGIKPPGSRQPLAPAQRPQSQAIGTFDYKTYTSSRTASRHSSQEENDYKDPLSATGSDASDLSPTAPARNNVLPRASSIRRPRPSLSDRTVDNLTQLGTPASVRRRSSFFNPQSPMATAQSERPPSSARNYPTAQKLTYGIRPPSAAGLTSPVKKSATGVPAYAGRRSVSSAVPRTGPSAAATSRLPGAGRPTSAASSHVRANSALPAPGYGSPSKQLPRQSALPGLKKPSRPVSMLPGPSGMTEDLKLPKPRPIGLKRPVSYVAKTSGDNKSDEEAPTANFKTSMSLRDQITKAKAAHRAATAKQLELSPTSSFDFENYDDPFGQKKSGGVDPLFKRIDAARRDGRLNIAGMNLAQIPPEVLQMYDAEAMEKSSVSWSECVDLIRFNAADNDLKELGDDCFPDIDKDALANDIDSKGLQFGGVEVIDLHGNSLTKLPLGLRRLERLDSLDLSRNQFDNSIFDILVQIPTLRHLNLANNNLSGQLPASIAALHQLETLDVSGNKLNLLPAALGELKHLRILKLSKNRLAQIDLDVLAPLPLKELYLSDNALTGALFPFSLTSMPKLEVLEVANNAIASLSFTNLSFPSIKRLDVSANRIVMFPDVSSWVNLMNLVASENELHEIPAGFTSLKTNLKSANFERNNIRRLDEGIAQMDGLQMLSVGGNPILPRKYLTMDCEGIKRDLASRTDPSAPVAAPENEDETF